MKPEFWFTATQRFDPSLGEQWTSYVSFSGLTNLESVVSLDGLLNPKIVLERIDEDWDFLVPDGVWSDHFRDLKYLLQRLGPRVTKANVLAIVVEPTSDFESHHPVPQTPSAFDFIGYDLIDGPGGISALTNCSGFDDVFLPEEQNENGLIGNFGRAKEIQALLRKNYPDEPHANCSLVGIWLLRQTLLN